MRLRIDRIKLLSLLGVQIPITIILISAYFIVSKYYDKGS